MSEKKQSIFYLEDLDDNWLPKRSQRLLSKARIVVGSGLVIGLIYAVGQVLIAKLSGLNVAAYASTSVFIGRLVFGLTPGLLLSGLFFGLLCGITVGLIGILVEHRPVETIRISLRNISSRLPRAARVAILVAPIFGLINGLKAVQWFGPKLALLYGMIFMLLYGLGFGFVTLLFGEAMETRRSPNQGTHRSIRIALMTCLIAGLIVWLIDGPLGGPNIWVGFRFREGMRFWLAAGAFHGLEVGPIFGLVSGGLFSLKHLFVRLALWRNQLAPFFYVSFLDYAVERIFLRKIGGGYIFIHRMLLEHFASLPSQPGQNNQ